MPSSTHPTLSMKRAASQTSLGTESPAKKQSKWAPEEDELNVELRGNGMKWEDIAKHFPGRSAIACRLRYQNYLEKRAPWDDEKKNKLARLYQRFKDQMWQKVASEMSIPWRSAEAMHWQLGEQEMSARAHAPVFQLNASATGGSNTNTTSSPPISHETHRTSLSQPPAVQPGQPQQYQPYQPQHQNIQPGSSTPNLQPIHPGHGTPKLQPLQPSHPAPSTPKLVPSLSGPATAPATTEPRQTSYFGDYYGPNTGARRRSSSSSRRRAEGGASAPHSRRRSQESKSPGSRAGTGQTNVSSQQGEEAVREASQVQTQGRGQPQSAQQQKQTAAEERDQCQPRLDVPGYHQRRDSHEATTITGYPTPHMVKEEISVTDDNSSTRSGISGDGQYRAQAKVNGYGHARTVSS